MDDLIQPPFVPEHKPCAELRPFTAAMNHIGTHTGHRNTRGPAQSWNGKWSVQSVRKGRVPLTILFLRRGTRTEATMA